MPPTSQERPRACLPELEGHHRIGFLGPLGEIRHVTDRDSLNQFVLAKPPGRTAGRSSLHLDAFGHQLAEHVWGVVVASRSFLLALSDAYAVSPKKVIHRHVVAQQADA